MKLEIMVYNGMINMIRLEDMFQCPSSFFCCGFDIVARHWFERDCSRATTETQIRESKGKREG